MNNISAMAAIVTRYHGPGQVRGSRIIASNGDFRVSVEVNNSLPTRENHIAALRKFCQRLNWKGTLVAGALCKGRHLDAYVWVWRQEGFCVADEIAIV